MYRTWYLSIIPAGGATIYSTNGAPALGNSNFINSTDPINDSAADTIAIADTVKAAAAGDAVSSCNC